MNSRWTKEAIEEYLPRPIPPVRVALWYRFGLLGVALTLVVLQAVYVAMVGLAAWATYRYLLVMPAVLVALRVNFITILVVVAPLVAGVIVTFFLLKPLLSRPAKQEELLILRREEEPELFAFIDRLCAVVGSPAPTQIAADLQVNAFARLHRGWWGLLTGELALTIGLPLVAGLNLPQWAGVLAHEFGHFSQKAGLRLYFLIGSIRTWFARVAYERDAWDARLEEWRATSGWRTNLILNVAYGGVWLSRAILRGLLHVAGIVTAWFSRQMEFDADRHEASLVGADVFAETTNRLTELGYAGERAWQVMERSWLLRRVPDDFPVLVRQVEAEIDATTRESLIAMSFAATTERFATHPSPADRIANVEGITGIVPREGVWSPAPPAASLFRDFAAVCRRTTERHYQQALGGELETAKVVAGGEFAREKASELRALDALAGMFPGARRPSRWFQLAEGAPPDGAIQFVAADQETTTLYWTLLEESLNRNAGLEFVRAGGKIQPAGFQLSAGDRETVEREAAHSRAQLEQEIEQLRNRYRGHGYLLGEDVGLREAYAAVAREQEPALELRHWLVAYRVIRSNLQFLGLAEAPQAQENATRRLEEIAQGILARTAAVKNPLAREAEGEPRSLADLLLAGAKPGESDAEEIAGLLLDRMDVVGERLLGELSLLGQKEGGGMD